MAALIAVCADKGSPGATTLAFALAAAQPDPPVLVEADPAGGDLAQRIFAATGRAHPPAATLLALAGEARRAVDPDLVVAHAALTPAGVPLVEGLAGAEQQAGLLPLWPTLLTALTASRYDVIADCGRLSGGHPGLSLIGAASRVVVAVRPHLEQLVRLRDRLQQLVATVAGDTSRFVVVVISPEETARADERAAVRILTDAGLGSVRVAWFAFAPKEAAALLTGRPNRRGYLWRGAAALSTELRAAMSPAQTAAPPAQPEKSIRTAGLAGEAAWTTR